MIIRTQDIDDILRNRTEKRQLGFSKGNTFSTATFTIEEEPQVRPHTLYLIALSDHGCQLICMPVHGRAAESLTRCNFTAAALMQQTFVRSHLHCNMYPQFSIRAVQAPVLASVLQLSCNFRC